MLPAAPRICRGRWFDGFTTHGSTASGNVSVVGGGYNNLASFFMATVGGAATTSLAAVPSELQRSVAALTILPTPTTRPLAVAQPTAPAGWARSSAEAVLTDQRALVWLGEYLGE